MSNGQSSALAHGSITSAIIASPSRSVGPGRRSAAILGFICLLLVIAADVLFYRQPLGWTPAIFAALLTAAMLVRRSMCLATWPGRLIVAAILGLCLALVEHPGPLRITMTLLAVSALAIVCAHGWTASVPDWIARGSELFGRWFFQLPLDLVSRSRWVQRRQGRWSGMRTVINWSVPVILSFVFIWLFAVANPIISTWLGTLGNSIERFFMNISDYVSFTRVLLWVLVGFAVWAMLRGRVRVGAYRIDTAIFAPRRHAADAPHASLIVRCLILFNLVFAVQLGLDLATVLSNGANLPEHMSYSEYARRGAYPLVATALLAAAFVLVTFHTGLSAEANQRMRWARRLVYVWIAQNIILTLSAAWRLGMYVEAFGLTRLRVAAAIWMLLVALGLVWIIWRLISNRSNSWLLRINTATLLIVLYACCLVNFDSMIAWYDVQRCEEVGGHGPSADFHYLRNLGPESIPALTWLSNQLPKDPTGQRAEDTARVLRNDMDEQMRSWQGWTLRRARLAASF